MIVRGRVVDEEGKPALGARVWLAHNGAWLPAHGWIEPDDGTAITDAKGEYAFDLDSRPWFAHMRVPARLRALLGQSVSQEIGVPAMAPEVTAPDLVLEAGVMGRVRVRWGDGSPAEGVSLLLILQKRADACSTAVEDPEEASDAASGTTDERGEMWFGPAQDREYPRISIIATHPESRQHASWESRRVGVFDVQLVRGREVRGVLRTADGRPAEGYRVAPRSESSGDPVEGSVVTADSLGRFTVAGVDHSEGGIAVLDRLPGRPSLAELAKMDRAEALARWAASTMCRVTNPLLLHDVPDGADDIGVLVLPEIGTLEIRLEDARGNRAVSGRVTWTRSNGRFHGSRSYRADGQGVVRVERMPLGIRAGFGVQIEDSELGTLEQEFVVRKVRAETITFRVTGAGTVIARLHPRGAPDQPLTVALARMTEETCCGRIFNGPLSELRWEASRGLHPVVRIGAKGFRERVVQNVTVRDDGPTFLDVELEPL